MFSFIKSFHSSWIYNAYVFIVCTFFPPVQHFFRHHTLPTSDQLTCAEYIYESPQSVDIYYTWTSPFSSFAIGQIPETYQSCQDIHFDQVQAIEKIPIYVEYTAPDVDAIRIFPPSYMWTVQSALFSKAHVHFMLSHLGKIDCWNPLYTLTIVDHDYNVIHISSQNYITFSKENHMIIHQRKGHAVL